LKTRCATVPCGSEGSCPVSTRRSSAFNLTSSSSPGRNLAPVGFVDEVRSPLRRSEAFGIVHGRAYAPSICWEGSCAPSAEAWLYPVDP
jgi:hypothetical protein